MILEQHVKIYSDFIDGRQIALCDSIVSKLIPGFLQVSKPVNTLSILVSKKFHYYWFFWNESCIVETKWLLEMLRAVQRDFCLRQIDWFIMYNKVTSELCLA